MSDTVYMKLYPGDFLADTMHLDAEEIGMYLLLIMAHFRNARPLPLDEKILAQIARANSSKKRQKMFKILQEFFQKTDDGFSQKRVVKELARRAEISAKNSANAALRQERVRQKESANAGANAVRTQCETECEKSAYQIHNHNQINKLDSNPVDNTDDLARANSSDVSPDVIDLPSKSKSSAKKRDYHPDAQAVAKNFHAVFGLTAVDTRRFFADVNKADFLLKTYSAGELLAAFSFVRNDRYAGPSIGTLAAFHQKGLPLWVNRHDPDVQARQKNATKTPGRIDGAAIVPNAQRVAGCGKLPRRNALPETGGQT